MCFHCRGRGFHPWSGKFHRPCDAVEGKKDSRMICLHWNLIMTFSWFTLSLLLVQSDVSRERPTACMEMCMWIVGCHKEGGRRWWYLAMKPEVPDVLLHVRYFAQKHKVLIRFYYMWIFPGMHLPCTLLCSETQQVLFNILENHITAMSPGV